MAGVKLALPAPYGYRSPSGTHVSLRCSRLTHKQKLFELLVDHGCPAFTARRALSSLEHSGRYDCYVVLGKSELRRFWSTMRSLGHDVEIGLPDEKLYVPLKWSSLSKLNLSTTDPVPEQVPFIRDPFEHAI